MNAPIVLLRALKGTCALNCLAALHLAGPLPVTHRTVMDLTGYDDGAVRKGLHTLLVLGLATSAGDARRTAWQLTPAANPLPLPLDLFLASPEKRDLDPLKEEEITTSNQSSLIESSSDLENPDFDFAKRSDPDSDATAAIDATATPAAEVAAVSGATALLPLVATAAIGAHPTSAASCPPLPVVVEDPRTGPNRMSTLPVSTATNLKTLASLRLRGEKVLNGPGESFLDGRGERSLDSRADKLLRAQFYAAFDAANVFLQFRRPLADDLLADDREAAAEDRPAWLRQALGWLCYAQRRLPNVRRGAVVYISLRDRLPCDPAYLPPPDLPFDAALAWALRGGEAEPPPDPDDDDTDQTFRVSETIKISDSPADQLWRAALERLSSELPPAVVDTHLRALQLITLDDKRCVLAAPTPQARDWLAHRLARVVAGALRELTGDEVTVEFTSVL